MAPTQTATPVRERILQSAFDLFYRQGYRGTGINQVIAESGVAKASFYDHFPSKDDLLYEYLREMSQREMAETRQYVAGHPTVRDRFIAPLRMLEPWFESSDYRGCPFQNILAEAPTQDPRVQAVSRQHHEALRQLLRELAEALVKAEPDLGHVDPTELADTYLLLMEGAIPLAVAYRQPWPVEKAIQAVECCLKVSSGG